LVINDIGPDGEAGSDRITAEAASTPDFFSSLEDGIAFRSARMPAFSSLDETEQRVEILHHLREAPDGRWVWKNDPEFLRQRVQHGAESHPQLWDVLARVPCPTLLLWGTASDVLSEAQARRMIAVLPRGELAPIPGVGHAPTLREPAAVEALDRFLAVPVTV
jgi:pimeloyl-ACP methyl ester carboxylesterase